MKIKRDKYLKEIISRKDNGLIKVITGIRRSGKSYLLFNLYYDYLIENNIKKRNIITFAFDDDDDIDKLDAYYPEEPTRIFEKRKKGFKVNSKKFRAYIKDITNENDHFYLLLDEIQNLDNFVGTLNSFIRNKNFDTYVTGSNSRLLSSDIITEFRGRGDQIKIYPLTFKEYFEAQSLPFDKAYREYQYYGGLPLVMSFDSNEKKSAYLKNLFDEVYIKDIVERNNIVDDESFSKLINILASSIGSFTTTTKLENTFNSELKLSYSHNTIKKHIEYLKDSYLLYEVNRYDVKGKGYIAANCKYYFADLGLRNARINFRQDEPTHIMENIIYNELLSRGYNVDVGIVEISEPNSNGNNVLKQLEVDFVVNSINNRYYIQSAYSMPNKEKLEQECRSLERIDDNFKKIIIVNENIKTYQTEKGITVISLEEFLLNESCL